MLENFVCGTLACELEFYCNCVCHTPNACDLAGLTHKFITFIVICIWRSALGGGRVIAAACRANLLQQVLSKFGPVTAG